MTAWIAAQSNGKSSGMPNIKRRGDDEKVGSIHAHIEDRR